MKTSPIIARIKDRMGATFGARVAGAAELYNALESGDTFPVPHAFVKSLPDEPSEPLTAGVVTQGVTDYVAIMVAVSNTADPRGQGADDVLDDIRTGLFAALVGWEPGDEGQHSAMSYDGYEDTDMTRGRLWRMFRFSAITQI